MDSTKQALSTINAFIQFDPNAPEGYYHKGLIYLELNKTDSAAFFFNRSLELYKKGYKNKDSYVEVQDELYLSDINEALEQISPDSF